MKLAKSIPVTFEGQRFSAKGFIGSSYLQNDNGVVLILPDVMGCKNLDVYRAALIRDTLGCSAVALDLYGDAFPSAKREDRDNIMEAFTHMNNLLVDPIRLRKFLGDYIQQVVPQVNGDLNRVAGKTARK